MERISKVKKCTDNPFLNYYELSVVHKGGNTGRYFMASRAREEETLTLHTGKVNADGVAIYALYGENRDRVVLVRQYRYPLGDYVYEFPAGLVEPGEEFQSAAIRELHEETGLRLTPVKVDPMYEKPYFTSVGMTDECCATVYGYADGEVSTDLLESSEDLEIVLADREEVKRILKEEKTALICAYMLMHFLHDEEPFGFLK